MSSVMDLNASPYNNYNSWTSTMTFEQHSAEDVTPHQHGHESSVETLHREREERRQRMTSLNKFKSERNKLPCGWLDCPNFGQEIASIIPSKVPLDESSFNDSIPSAKKYSFAQVLKKFKVGMVVDLTNTDRYYSTTDLKEQGVKYLKIRCKGRDSVPDNQSVNTFVFEVERYILNQPEKRVLVHCTHGHNRTGYMIVNYLMRTQQAPSVTEAIQRFSKSRPPGIYKQDYIDSLYAFYHEPKPELLVCPCTPDWKRSDNGVSSYAPPIINEKRQDDINIVLMTNDDVLGDKIPDEQELELRRFCLNMLRLRGNSHFPGSHPVSLDRENLQLLRQRYYYATWKADGTRYMLLLCAHGCYLIDRSFKFRRVQMRFPWKNQGHHFTLLDGEMIIDTIGPEKQDRRYLIYDLIALNGVSKIELPFCDRWKMIDNEIIQPRYHEREHPPKAPYRYDLEPFRVRRKGFWLLSTARKLLKDFIPKQLSHEADGLIFQGWDDPYVPRTHDALLKWKYPEMNSVDFLFEIREDDGAECLYLHQGGKKRLMDDNNRVVFRDAAFDKPSSLYSGKIIECWWDSEENVWVCMRVRVDKSTPNEYKTYTKVMKSIKDNITEEVLLNAIDEIISLPMYTDRIQIDTRSQQKTKQPPKKRKLL